MALGESKKNARGTAEASSRPLPSETGTPKSLKPERKIVKKPPNQNSSKKKESKVSKVSQVKTKDQKKSTPEGNKEKGATDQRKDDKKQNSLERNKEKKTITNEEHNEKKQQDQKDKEKLGGLIFMCNGKTKPDCFHYWVMGVPITRTELVMGIKPGLKLFLYDFDLKLMYGIYEASSAGGMKLEPMAFGGAFPVQVRFKVHKDCFPLPESVFRKAIEDNYNEKNKFKTELTVQQVKKLIELFQPSPQVHSNAHSSVPVPLPPLLRAPLMPAVPAREIFEGRREPPLQAPREPFKSSPYSLDTVTKSGHEREQVYRHHISVHRDVASIKGEVRNDPLFLSEKEYRTYGLARKGHTLPPPATDTTAPTLGPYEKDHDRDKLLRHAAPLHRETDSKQKEAVSNDPLFLSEKEYRAYGLGRKPPASTPPAAAFTPIEDSYYSYNYGAASSDGYPLQLRREATSSETYSLVPRRDAYLTKSNYLERGTTDHSRNGAGEAGLLYSTYASNALSDYNQKHHLEGRHELAPTSVLSRYSFSGPSLSYR